TRIHYGPGIPRSEAPGEDDLEDLWRAYYSSVYNPARLNLDAMRAQLPVFRWEDLPESRVIPELVRISRGRVDSMKGMQSAGASCFIPPQTDLPGLQQAVRHCGACELCARATQPVFGEGPHNARIMLVGEQPGDEEDQAGRPFVGPAGQVLDAAIRDAGMNRDSLYLTNAVKAFRFEERGKRRIHQTPRSIHIASCRPWLEAEIDLVRPERIVCLGATAAQAVLGRTVKIQAERGRIVHQRRGADVIVTYHPSAILRAPDQAVRTQYQQSLIADLKLSLACRDHVPLGSDVSFS
ncbi:MAG: UdgX family uracil-DNA binding protein, partial [Acidobacteriaceae bacterium]|nr:UdgX family uracil-DNA binding protein [Acidobacteriaceae bacterium]